MYTNRDRLPIFVGYDPREELAWQVCRDSIERRASIPVDVRPIRHKYLRDRGLFNRGWLINGEDGQMIDAKDLKPCSTEFSFTRFLTPHLARLNGYEHGWALFVDCDFLFMGDVAEIVEGLDGGRAVHVVDRDWTRIPEGRKMDNVRQEKYPRKLWSSLMAFNLIMVDNDRLTVEAVNEWDGYRLHGFEWLEPNSHEMIGFMDRKWNHIPEFDGDVDSDTFTGAVHYSLGGPYMGIRGMPGCDDAWLRAFDDWKTSVSDETRGWDHPMAMLTTPSGPA